jgi:hypothetical protein
MAPMHAAAGETHAWPLARPHARNRPKPSMTGDERETPGRPLPRPRMQLAATNASPPRVDAARPSTAPATPP